MINPIIANEASNPGSLLLVSSDRGVEAPGFCDVSVVGDADGKEVAVGVGVDVRPDV